VPPTHSTSEDKGYESAGFICISDGNIFAKDEDLVTFQTCWAVTTLQENM